MRAVAFVAQVTIFFVEYIYLVLVAAIADALLFVCVLHKSIQLLVPICC